MRSSRFLVGLCMLLWACGSQPAPVTTPENAVSVSIADTLGNALTQFRFAPKHSPCFKAKVNKTEVANDLDYRWYLDGTLLDSVSRFCLIATQPRSHMSNLRLETRDQVGNLMVDSVELIQNTPPAFSKDRERFTPQEDSQIPVMANMGMRFTWSAGDPDPGDSLRFTLRIGTAGAWTDSAVTGSTQGMRWPQDLLPSTDYQWQVRAEDLWGDADTTATWHFRTLPLWQQPGAVHGKVTPPVGADSAELASLRLVALSVAGDTMVFPLDSAHEFLVFPSPMLDSIRVFAWDTKTGARTDTLTAKIVSTSATNLSIPLKF